MVKSAARPPAERRQTIETCIKSIKYNTDPVLQEFGIEVGEQFSSIPARVLDQPSLAYAQNRVGSSLKSITDQPNQSYVRNVFILLCFSFCEQFFEFN